MMNKLATMPYAQAHTVTDNKGNVFLYSYKTLVAGIRDNWVFCNGLYSMTTRRHLGAWAKEHMGLSFQLLKKLYEDDMEMNIETGEVRERS